MAQANELRVTSPTARAPESRGTGVRHECPASAPRRPQSPPLPTLADIEEAREALRDVSIYTPMEESRWLSGVVGGPVLLKAENLQRTGSFKIRGAYLRISRLSEDERAHGVVAASAGNHAQGVALAAQMLGIKATVFMPEGAPIPKEKATRGYGADVRLRRPQRRRRARSPPRRSPPRPVRC